ncbi:MOSC domain protein [Dactylonectria estremocensis]|uniref:MOSC domain protein n=1 Tax=Dactylonectria estremocensis TaxID=1079267 RepID=A0A9P9FBN5_9HYPO|nr:MOSC domain protein [Dactylonectria estremocensis]
MSMRVEQIYTYPIKSLRGVPLGAIQATQTGFAYDRRFMLWDVDKSENLHIGLRPALCLFTTKLTPETDPQSIRKVGHGLSHAFDQPSDAVEALTLSVTVTMHQSPCPAYDMGEKYNQWFSRRLGYPVKLLYIGDYRRKVLGNMGQGITAGAVDLLHPSLAAVPVILILLGYLSLYGSSARPVSLALNMVPLFASCLILAHHLRGWLLKRQPMITFADLAAYLIISKTSYEVVNNKLPDSEELDITKFRANIVISGPTKAYDEDFWAELRFRKGITMKITQNCARCSSLNVDYATGKPGKTEAGKVLKKLSKDRRVDPGMKWSPIFGRYGFLTSTSDAAGDVVIKVGDEVEVMRRNSERTVTGKDATDYPKS